MDNQKTGAQILIECLLEQKVDTVFGYPGGAVLNIYDALYEYSDQIRHVLTAHEQGAAHAADGYARATGRTGVVIATSGPGATNLVTGIANAYMDSIPMVAITGNVAVDLLGRDSFQEIDITGITMPITKHNYIVKDIETLADIVRDAFVIANSGRKGPVLIDIPKDITAKKTKYTKKEAAEKRKSLPPKEKKINLALELIKQSKKPMIYAGGGVISSECSRELVTFGERLQIPVATSMMALGCIPADHPLNLGMIGMHGTVHANLAAHKCDLLIVAGARFSDRVATSRSNFAKHAKIIHIDIDYAEFDKNVVSSVHIAGDLKEVIAELDKGLSPADHSEWLTVIEGHRKPLKKVDHSDFPHPDFVIEKVNALCKDPIVVTDVGQHQMWTAQYYPFQSPRTFLTSGGLGTMGFGLGAAIGAQAGMPDRQVVLFSGDGSFHMNLHETTTLASYGFPVIVIIMNNSVLGMVRQWQKVFYGNRFSQTDPHRKTDFVALAKAFGIDGLRIETPEDVEPVLKQAIALQKPVIIDCRISPDANVLPMIPPGGSAEEIITEM